MSPFTPDGHLCTSFDLPFIIAPDVVRLLLSLRCLVLQPPVLSALFPSHEAQRPLSPVLYAAVCSASSTVLHSITIIDISVI